MKAFRGRRSRRRLGVVLLIVGVIILAYRYPRFADAWTAVRHTSGSKGAEALWPPEIWQQIQQEIRKVHWEFYEQATIMGFGLLFVICGLALCSRSRAMMSSPEGRRRHFSA